MSRKSLQVQGNHQFISEILTVVEKLSGNLRDPTYPYIYWQKWFNLLEELMFSANSIEELENIYFAEYPLNPLKILENASIILREWLLIRWIMGIKIIIEYIWEILEEYSFNSSDRDEDEYFNEISYEFYQERIEWAHAVGPSYPSPDNRPQIGLRNMIINEYGDPYYFPIEDEGFSQPEEYSHIIEKFLKCLFLPIKNCNYYIEYYKKAIKKQEISKNSTIFNEMEENTKKILQIYRNYELDVETSTILNFISLITDLKS